MTSSIHLSLAKAQDMIHAALVAAGVPQDVSSSVAAALVAAEAEGQVGHGFSRLGDYVAQVRTGKITQPPRSSHTRAARLLY